MSKSPLIKNFIHALNPLQAIPKSTMITLSVSWVAIIIVVWFTAPSPILPSPIDVFGHIPALFGPEEGLGAELWISLSLNMQAVGLMALISLLLSYATVIPAMKPLATIISTGRFNGMVGLPLILTLWLHDPHYVKIALLVYGMGVFTIPSVVKIIEAIPKERFDLARTLRMSEWRVVFEVVVLESFDEIIEVLRTNIAMGWMMLPMVEGMFKSEGGVGAFLLNENKHFNLDAVYGTVLVILVLGFIQDYVIGVIKNTLCPFSNMGREQQ